MSSTPETPAPAAGIARPAEDYLRSYHDAGPGRMQEILELHRLGDGRTTYEALADRLPDPRRVLDLGCADGNLLAVLARRGAGTLAGIDLSEREIELGRLRPELAAADLRVGRAQELPWPDASFDAVTAHLAFMLMDEAEVVAAEVARVLDDGGVFAVALPGGPAPGSVWDVFRELLPKYHETVPEERRIPSIGDPRARTREGIEEILTPAGFGAIDWVSVEVGRDVRPEDLWDAYFETLYGLETVSDDKRRELRTEFVAAARLRARPDDTVPNTRILNLVTARAGG